MINIFYKKSKDYLDYFSQVFIDNEYFWMDINWFTSWLFAIPSLIEFYYNYLPLTFFGIFIPSLINHAHIKKYDHIINPIEKVFVLSTGSYLFLWRFTSMLNKEVLLYDIIIWILTYIGNYIYFIARLSNGHKYSSLFHTLVHVCGVTGISLCYYIDIIQ